MFVDGGVDYGWGPGKIGSHDGRNVSGAEGQASEFWAWSWGGYGGVRVGSGAAGSGELAWEDEGGRRV